jgi:hypothetical protein
MPPKKSQKIDALLDAVEAWISTIRREEALASVKHSVTEIDRWEKAQLVEDEMRNAVKAANANTRCAPSFSDCEAFLSRRKICGSICGNRPADPHRRDPCQT